MKGGEWEIPGGREGGTRDGGKEGEGRKGIRTTSIWTFFEGH
jgi:hypothetical protein